MAIPTTVGDPVPIVLILEDGNESVYPQAKIYAAGAVTPVATIDLPHKVDGRYEDSWTPTAVGIYTAQFKIFADAARTIEDITYTRSVDQVVVTSSSVDDLALNIVRVLGLVHENVFIDETDHDPDGQLVSCRVRLYDSKSNVENATDGGDYTVPPESVGLVAVYEMDTVYEAQGKMGAYRMKRVV